MHLTPRRAESDEIQCLYQPIVEIFLEEWFWVFFKRKKSADTAVSENRISPQQETEQLAVRLLRSKFFQKKWVCFPQNIGYIKMYVKQEKQRRVKTS